MPPAVRSKAQTDQATAPAKPVPLLKAQPKLFRILIVVFALWMAGLLAMYFTTVFPNRHSPQPRTEAAR